MIIYEYEIYRRKSIYSRVILKNSRWRHSTVPYEGELQSVLFLWVLVMNFVFSCVTSCYNKQCYMEVCLYFTWWCHQMETFSALLALCVGEFTGNRWIPRTKASDAELWCFLWSASEKNGWANNRDAGDLRRHRAHYNVTVRDPLFQTRLNGIWDIFVSSKCDPCFIFEITMLNAIPCFIRSSYVELFLVVQTTNGLATRGTRFIVYFSFLNCFFE